MEQVFKMRGCFFRGFSKGFQEWYVNHNDKYSWDSIPDSQYWLAPKPSTHNPNCDFSVLDPKP